VHEREGEGAVSPLTEFGNVLVTPHMGAGTVDSKRMIGEQVVGIVAEHAAADVAVR
jgi:phosphoglycerate dehydrogenase-like enzyme